MAKVGWHDKDVDVKGKCHAEKAVRGMWRNIVSNTIGDVKSCHSSLRLEIFVGDDQKEKLERKIRLPQGSTRKKKKRIKKCYLMF